MLADDATDARALRALSSFIISPPDDIMFCYNTIFE